MYRDVSSVQNGISDHSYSEQERCLAYFYICFQSETSRSQWCPCQSLEVSNFTFCRYISKDFSKALYLFFKSFIFSYLSSNFSSICSNTLLPFSAYSYSHFNLMCLLSNYSYLSLRMASRSVAAINYRLSWLTASSLVYSRFIFSASMLSSQLSSLFMGSRCYDQIKLCCRHIQLQEGDKFNQALAVNLYGKS